MHGMFYSVHELEPLVDLLSRLSVDTQVMMFLNVVIDWLID